MKLRNKKTGKIVDIIAYETKKQPLIECDYQGQFETLAKLNEDWEDYRPLEEFWFINSEMSVVQQSVDCDRFNIEIGNYFETKEEAEKAVEKLKCWQRLKDKGLRFEGWHNNLEKTLGNLIINVSIKRFDGIADDLDICFGGKE